MQYEDIKYIPESEDPSLSIETDELVAKIIYNTGLLLKSDDNYKCFFSKYGKNRFIPFSHHRGGSRI